MPKIKQPALVTKDSLAVLLYRSHQSRRISIIGRALLVILFNQTEDERETKITTESNGVGFTGTDADLGTSTAEYYLQHRTLGDWAVGAWMKEGSTGYPRICKYHKQLNNAAVQKAVLRGMI